MPRQASGGNSLPNEWHYSDGISVRDSRKHLTTGDLNSEWITDLGGKAKTIKVLEECIEHASIFKTGYEKQIMKFLKMDKLDFIRHLKLPTRKHH